MYGFFNTNIGNVQHSNSLIYWISNGMKKLKPGDFVISKFHSYCKQISHNGWVLVALSNWSEKIYDSSWHYSFNNKRLINGEIENICLDTK